MDKFYKIVNKTTLEEATLEEVKSGNGVLKNPSLKLLHKLGYWPMDPEIVVPEQEEGYKIFDDGYQYVLIDGAEKIVTHKYRKLKIVDCEMPEIGENQELMADFWEETDTEYRHIIKVYDIIDNPVEIDDATQYLKEKEWVVDDEAQTKTAVYHVIPRVDNPPTLEDGQIVVDDRWQINFTPEGQEIYEHLYEVRFVIDNPPALADDERVVDEGFDDDGVHRVKWYKVMKVVDVQPELEEGQEIVDSWFTDDPETNTRTFHYEVRFIVDEPVELAENQKIESEWWDDDGTTRTHRREIHTYIDEPPVLAEDEDIISDNWNVVQDDEYHFTHTRVYEVRKIIDHSAPELDDTHFIYNEGWNDDGITHEKFYDVWELKDEEVPEFDPLEFKLIDLGIVDDPENKTRGKKYFLKPIIRNKPEDDPDGNFKYVEDDEEEDAEQIVIKYKRVDRVWRSISKLALEYALFKMGLLDKFDAFIDGLTMTNEQGQQVGVRRFYNQANILRENHPLFKPYFKTACEAFEMTEEQADALINQCLAEE